MKLKRIFYFMLLTPLMHLQFQCDDREYHTQAAKWEIVNNTSSDLRFNAYTDDGRQSLSVLLSKDSYESSFVLYEVASYKRPEHYEFDELYKCIYLGNVVEVTDLDGTVLARWNYSERNGGDKQFYNEKSWRKNDDNDRYARISWIFYLNEENFDAKDHENTL